MGPQTDIGESLELRKRQEEEYYTNLQNGIKKTRKKNTHLTPKKKKRK